MLTMRAPWAKRRIVRTQTAARQIRNILEYRVGKITINQLLAQKLLQVSNQNTKYSLTALFPFKSATKRNTIA
ncbi:MAG: hypothetical protein AAGI25_18085 [Bacteroidota bacterium]